jgi:hypothetical protein
VNSQWERTRLAWRRTILTVLVVGGIGAVHLATGGLLALAALCGAVTALGCLPALWRLTALRIGTEQMATWEPAVLTACGCLLALSVLFAR